MTQEANPVHKLALSVQYVVPDTVVTRLANNFASQVIPGGICFYFFETMVPLVLGSPEEQKEQWAQITSVRSECFAKIFVPNANVGDFVNSIKSIHATLDSILAQQDDAAESPNS